MRGLAAFAVAGSALGGYAVGVEPFRVVTTRYRLTPEGWPPALRLRIAVLTDIHACAPWMTAARVRSIVDQTTLLRPDLVVLLGDYVGAVHPWLSEPVAPEAWAAALGALEAPLGAHAVLGNHDWWEDPAAQARGGGPTVAGAALRRHGVAVYENDAVRLEKDGAGFWLLGLGDQIALAPRYGFRGPGVQGVDDLPGALAQVTDDAPAILLAHEPDIFPRVPARVALTLSGHTHGGQIRLFGWSPIIPSAFGDRYAYGHIVEPDAAGRARSLIVSRGLGCTSLPVRLGAPPEIVLIELGGDPTASGGV